MITIYVMVSLNESIVAVAVASGAILAGLILHVTLTYLLSRRHSRKPFMVKGMSLRLAYWTGPLRAILSALCLSVVLPYVEFHPEADPIIGHVLALWIIGALAWFTLRTVAMAREMILSRFDIASKDNLKARRVYTQLRVFERVLAVIISLIAIAGMLMTFDSVRELGVSILASAGVLGIIIGFAAQRSIGTLLAGIQIAITQPIRIEDAVIVEGEWGRIEEITLTYVVVKIWDERRLVVPITHFIEKPFQNWTRTTAQLLGSVYLYVDYTFPVEEARKELKRIVEGTPLWDRRLCLLQVTNTTERSVELRAVMSAEDSSKAWDLRCYVREKLIEFMQERFPESLPRMRVEMERGVDVERSGREEEHFAARPSH